LYTFASAPMPGSLIARHTIHSLVGHNFTSQATRQTAVVADAVLSDAAVASITMLVQVASWYGPRLHTILPKCPYQQSPHHSMLAHLNKLEWVVRGRHGTGCHTITTVTDTHDEAHVPQLDVCGAVSRVLAAHRQQQVTLLASS
jgi:hypothetical protein